MTERLRNTLEILEVLLISKEIPEVQGLLPGLSEDEVRSRLAQVFIEPHPDLVTLFGWHNGQGDHKNQVCSGWFLASTMLLSLEQACTLFDTLRDCFEARAQLGGTDGVEWSRSWISKAGRG